MEKIEKLCEWIRNSDNIVFFGGAGVSTESGIPDFRSVDGLYHQKYDVPPEEILSHTYFYSHPDRFFRFYRDKMIYPNAEPNMAHKVLAELEKRGKLKAIITQNIDGLHQKAGSNCVYELHGSVLRNYCAKCHRFVPMSEIQASAEVPHCQCGGIIKPDVVLYEESLNTETIYQSVEKISNADVLIVGGTSLAVYPAAGLINYYRGNKMVLINLAPTQYDGKANLILAEKIGSVFERIGRELLD